MTNIEPLSSEIRKKKNSIREGFIIVLFNMGCKYCWKG